MNEFPRKERTSVRTILDPGYADSTFPFNGTTTTIYLHQKRKFYNNYNDTGQHSGIQHVEHVWSSC